MHAVGLDLGASKYSDMRSTTMGFSIGKDVYVDGDSTIGFASGKENQIPNSGARARASSSLSSCTSTTSASTLTAIGGENGWTPFPSLLQASRVAEAKPVATALLPTQDSSSASSSWRAPLQPINHVNHFSLFLFV